MTRRARGTPRRTVAAAALWLALAGPFAAAHPLAPVRFELRASADGTVDGVWSESLPRVRGANPQPRLPGACRVTAAPRVETTLDAMIVRWRADCGAAGLVGRTLEVSGLPRGMIVVARVALPDGRTVERVLTADDARFVVPAAPHRGAVFASYLRLGVVHIAGGPDHLLFVFGLVLLASTWRRILGTVTAFTIGHSITLALAALGVVTPPQGPIELAIAVSVLVVAIEVARADVAYAAPRGRPWLVAGSFGLLHGLGFASVLREAGLPADALVPALLAFNLGIELGQVAFVLLVLALRALARRRAPLLPAWTARLPAYVMGSLAAYWCYVRAAAWLASGTRTG